MRVGEAKDLLVRQTAEQAAIEGVPLSDLEKRMMYFTESRDAVEDPVKLNEEFEAEYETSEYESKISGLLHHAYSRIKKENPETVREWDEALRELRKDDHYILVLWDLKSGGRPSADRPPYDGLKLLGTALLVVVVGMVLMFGYYALADHFGFHFRWNTEPKTYHSIPAWVQRLVLAIGAGIYIYYVVVPLITKKPVPGLGQLMLKLLRTKPKDTSGN